MIIFIGLIIGVSLLLIMLSLSDIARYCKYRLKKRGRTG